MIDNPYKTSSELISQKLLGDGLKDICINDTSLAKYVYDNMQENPSLITLKETEGQKAFDNFFKLTTFIQQLQAFNTDSATNYVIGNLDDEDPSQTRSFSGNDRREIIGGVEVLSNKIYKQIIENYGKGGSNTFRCYGCNIKSKAEVKSIKDTDDDGYTKVKFKLTIGRARPIMKEMKGHYVIFTPTSKIATQIKFDPPLSTNKLNALKNIHYSSSLKIFLAFSEAFWENNADNKIPSIPFGENVNDPEAVFGAASFADDLLIQVSL